MLSRTSFACKCCGRLVLDNKLWNMAVQAYSTVPFLVTSGYRCDKHNKAVGGKPDSKHLEGKAMDIFVASSYERVKILEAVLKVGFKRIGLGKNFIHVDVGSGESCWLY